MTDIATDEYDPRWPALFALILAVSVGFQVVRLEQTDAGSWIVVDYVYRAFVLVLLAVLPTRKFVFRTERLRTSRARLLLWFGGAVGAIFAIVQLGDTLDQALPHLSFGQYPSARGMLRLVDLTFGLALVAVHEELVFRRLARLVFGRLGDGFAMIAATSIVFGLYHWWTGLPNIVMIALIGAVLMMLYRAVGALWPAIVAHYLLDLYAFG